MTAARAKTPIPPSELTRALRNERQWPDKERILKALRLLHVSGVLSVPFIRTVTSLDLGVPPLLGLLAALGRCDLSVARLYEGHVNALQLIARLGTRSQLERVDTAAANGGLIGVWGADDPASPARGRRVGKRCYLSGRKTYASGADVVTHAVIAVKTADNDTQLILLDGVDVSRRHRSRLVAAVGDAGNQRRPSRRPQRRSRLKPRLMRSTRRSRWFHRPEAAQ